MERKGNRSIIYIVRTSLHGCLLGLLSSHSLAQNDCGHISNIPADHVHRGKGWMLSVDAVAVANGEKPTVGTSRSGVPAILSHKDDEVAFVHCSLPRRG